MPPRQQIYSASAAIARMIDEVTNAFKVERQIVNEIIAQAHMAGVNLMAGFADSGGAVSGKQPLAGSKRAAARSKAFVLSFFVTGCLRLPYPRQSDGRARIGLRSSGLRADQENAGQESCRRNYGKVPDK